MINSLHYEVSPTFQNFELCHFAFLGGLHQYLFLLTETNLKMTFAFMKKATTVLVQTLYTRKVVKHKLLESRGYSTICHFSLQSFIGTSYFQIEGETLLGSSPGGSREFEGWMESEKRDLFNQKYKIRLGKNSVVGKLVEKRG